MSKQALHNEQELVQAMQAGSEDAFTALYRHYSPVLYLNILRMLRDPLLAEELVQELFTRIWQKKSQLGLQENFEGYIYSTARNLVYDFFRKLKRDKQLMQRFRVWAQENYEPVEEALLMRQSSEMLQKALQQLSPQQKKVYELVKQQGLSYKKAADILGISPFTVKEYLVAANKIIRKYLLNGVDSAAGLLLVAAIRAGLS